MIWATLDKLAQLAACCASMFQGNSKLIEVRRFVEWEWDREREALSKELRLRIKVLPQGERYVMTREANGGMRYRRADREWYPHDGVEDEVMQDLLFSAWVAATIARQEEDLTAS